MKKNLDTPKIVVIIVKLALNNVVLLCRVMSPKDADEMTNIVEPASFTILYIKTALF